MSSRNKQGSSKWDELLSVQRQLGIQPKELEDEPKLDEVLYECWSWFLRLNSRRQSGMNVSPISYEAMKAFFWLMDYKPQQWEIDMIEGFDNVALEFYAQQQLKEQQKMESKNKK